MKVLSRTLSLLAIIFLPLFFANCGSDGGGGTSSEKIQLNKLSKTWNIESAELTMTSTEDRTDEFEDFTLAISGTFDSNAEEGDYPYNFTVGGSRPTPSPWPSSGSWEFGGDPKTQLVRDDGVGMTYSIGSDGKLTLTFLCSDCDYVGARAAEVNGTWKFILTP